MISSVLRYRRRSHKRSICVVSANAGVDSPLLDTRVQRDGREAIDSNPEGRPGAQSTAAALLRHISSVRRSRLGTQSREAEGVAGQRARNKGRQAVWCVQYYKCLLRIIDMMNGDFIRRPVMLGITIVGGDFYFMFTVCGYRRLFGILNARCTSSMSK